MKISMEIDSRQLQAYLERTVVRVRRTATKFVHAEALQILEESLAQVPRDTGALASAGFVEEQNDGSYIIGYSNDVYNAKSDADTGTYMLKQHEDLSLDHPNGGKAKFLEDPANEHAAKFEAKAASIMREAMR